VLTTIIANSTELKGLRETVVQDAPDRNEPTSSNAFHPIENTKATEFDPNDPTKTVRIGTQLMTK
jgi:hypothetical protein